MARGCSLSAQGCSPDRTGLQPGFRRVAGASAADGDRDAEEMRLTTATMATLTPTMRWPVESRTRVTLRNFWRPVVVTFVMAFHSGRMQPAKSASVCCRVPKRQKAPGQFGDERAWMHCVWCRGSVYSTCVLVCACMCRRMCACACARVHVHALVMHCASHAHMHMHMPVDMGTACICHRVCLLGVAIEAAPSGLGRGEPLRRREVVLLVVARLGVISSG